MRKKVTVVGSGNVGATAAHWLASKEHRRRCIDRHHRRCPTRQGSRPASGDADREARLVSFIGTNDYADTANSDIVVITAGIPRKPGMSRDDLLNTNYKIMSDVVGKAVQYSPELHPHHRLQSAGRHGAGRLQAERLLAQSRHRHGRHFGFGTLPRLYRDAN